MSPRLLAAAVAGIALLATLGEGGASALGGTVLHGAVAIAVAVALVSGWPGERGTLATAPLAAFLAFVACALAGSAIAPDAYAAILVLVEIATFLGVAWLASRSGADLPARLAPILAAGAGAHGLFALAQRFALGFERPPSTFLNVNHFAAWLVAALLLAAAHALVSPPGRRRLFLVLLAPAVAALALGGSRGAILGLLTGGGCLVLLSWGAIGRSGRVAVAVGVAAVALAAGAGVAWRFRTPDPFPYQRAGIGKAALVLAAERPWTGSGPGQFAAAAANLNFPVEGRPLRYARVFATPHSDWLRAPAEFGGPAAGALALAVLLSIRLLAKRRREGRLTGADAGGVAALAALAAQGLVDDLTSRPALWVLAAALLGALLAERRDETPPPWPRTARVAGAGLVLFAFVVGDLAPYRAWRADDPRFNPLDAGLWGRRAESIASGTTEIDLRTYLRGREAAERAARLDPSDARWALARARIEGLGVRALFRDVAGRDRVAALYERAEDLARTNALIPFEGALFLRGSGDPARARRSAERSLRLEPGAVAPRLLLAAILIDAGGSATCDETLRLVAEAESLAARAATLPTESVYERRLLALDPRDAGALRSRCGS